MRVGASDVHEHGKMLVDGILSLLGTAVVDGDVSTDPADLEGADVVAVSTYNGVALRYVGAVRDALAALRSPLPVCVSGHGQAPDYGDSVLPVDVTRGIAALGALPCVHPRFTDRPA